VNKIVLNIRYRMGYQLTWVVWTLIIFVVVMFIVFYPLIKFSLIGRYEGSLVYRLFLVLVINHFAWTMRFKEDFDFLLTLSNTRNDIFKSIIGVAVIFSALFSVLIILERLIVDFLNNLFGYYNITDPFFFFSPYSTDNLFIQFAFFFILCVCSSMLGLLIGSLIYRFGKKFTIAFWLTFSIIPIVFIPLLLWTFYERSDLSRSVTGIGEFLKNFDLLTSSIYLFILAIIFCLSAYLNIRRLPQK
jgi:hypothetical protein